MAGRGPSPKATEQRRRRNRAPEGVDLPADGGGARPLALPRSYGDDEGRVDYLAGTREWFDAFCASPEASQFTAMDLRYLRDVVAPLYDRFLRRSSKDLAAELRLQLSQFGATPDAKKRQGWKAAPRDDGDQRVRPPAPVRRLRAVDPGAVEGA